MVEAEINENSAGVGSGSGPAGPGSDRHHEIDLKVDASNEAKSKLKAPPLPFFTPNTDGDRAAKSERETIADAADLDFTDAYYKALITEAPFIYGDHGIPPGENKLDSTDWFEPHLIQEGKDFVRRNFYSVMLAHLVSLMWIFTYKPGRSVLLKTGESHDKKNSLTRYLSTVLHIKLWYESDFIDKCARGSQDLYAVRKMHSAAAKNYEKTELPSPPELSEENQKLFDAIRCEMKKLELVVDHHDECPASILTETPAVPMSQFDMVMTQFCFIGFLVLLPQSFGMKKGSKKSMKGMDGFVHLWAVFGRQLGIEDRFNLAIHYKRCGGLGDDGTKNVNGFKKIFSNIFLPNFKNTDETALVMWDSLIYGISKYLSFLRLKSMVKFMMMYGADCQNLENFNSCMNWRDKLSFKILKIGTHTFSRTRTMRKMRNSTVRVTFANAQRKYLADWHRQPQQQHAKSCPV